MIERDEHGQAIIEKREKYIYVSSEQENWLEEVMNEKKIILSQRFINIYNVTNFFSGTLQNLNGIDYFVIVLKAFKGASKDDEILSMLKLLLQKETCKIIVVEQGVKKGNVLISDIIKLGIYNCITPADDNLAKSLLKKAVTGGMTYSDTMAFRVDEATININQNTKVVKNNFIKVKTNISIGIASSEKHLGATTVAINLVNWLNQIPNTTACYIENNNHNSIRSLENYKESAINEEEGKITINRINYYQKPNSEILARIQATQYDFYVYDYGNYNEMTELEKNSFVKSDLKILVSGSKAWETENLINALMVLNQDVNTFLLINFTELEERQNFKESIGEEWSNKTYFIDNTPNPFKMNSNTNIFEKLFTPYLQNTEIKEKKKKFKFNLFGKKGDKK